jgi:hypothetical protein
VSSLGNASAGEQTDIGHGTSRLPEALPFIWRGFIPSGLTVRPRTPRPLRLATSTTACPDLTEGSTKPNGSGAHRLEVPIAVAGGSGPIEAARDSRRLLRTCGASTLMPFALSAGCGTSLVGGWPYLAFRFPVWPASDGACRSPHPRALKRKIRHHTGCFVGRSVNCPAPSRPEVEHSEHSASRPGVSATRSWSRG